MVHNGQQQTQDTLHDHGIGWAILLVVIAVLVWLFWVFFDIEVREIVRWIRHSEMWVVSWFAGEDYTVFYNGKSYNFQQGFDAVAGYEKGRLRYEHLAYFTALSMQPLRLPFVVLLALGSLYCIFWGPNTQYRNKLSIEGLIKVQSKIFPAIAPFLHFNPSSQLPRPPGAPVPAELPPFAEALGPEEWLAFNNIKTPDGRIDQNSAGQAFVSQLGVPWRGARKLAPYKQILLAAFCLKVSRKRERSDDMLGRLARCWSVKNGLKLSKDRMLLKEELLVLKDKNLAGKTLAQANHHAFESTALIRALQYAREEGGVLAPAQFVWMRAYDRTLWYPLNNLGRQAFHMEALGAMSHFKAEKLTRRPIPVPKIENALKTIEDYMKSGRARPIPQLDYTKSKKRGVKKAV